jgi:hypothetical protein
MPIPQPPGRRLRHHRRSSTTWLDWLLLPDRLPPEPTPEPTLFRRSQDPAGPTYDWVHKTNQCLAAYGEAALFFLVWFCAALLAQSLRLSGLL